MLQVAVELRDRILVGVDRWSVQVMVLCSNDLDIVLEHVQTLGAVDALIIQRVVHIGD
jgi:hypothetical protein